MSTSSNQDPHPFELHSSRIAGDDRGRFDVEWTHRLLTTRDALDPSNPVLTGLLPEGDGPARLLAVVDRGLVEARPELPAQIEHWAESNPAAVRLVGDVVTVNGGEQSKQDFGVFEQTTRAINDGGICRKSFVLVVGGGAVLDAVGYAAASAHRGVRLIRMPSTTLGQADAGVGVKNGINAYGKKNFLGVFSPPWAVVNDTNLLTSLCDRHWRSGLSESVKVALLKDPAFFDLLCSTATQLRRRDLDVMEQVVHRTALLHMNHIVEGGDAFELEIARPLDFGHWSAHKLEQMSGFELAHGEAVAIGLTIDLAYGAMMGLVPEPVLRRTRRCLRDMGFTLSHAVLADHETLLEGLREFREHLGGRLTITLVREAGDPVDLHEIDLVVMRRAIEAIQQAGVNEASRAG
ncbi:MAG: 3-dehydroquinate synthase [Planctomycetota bacterium]|nr:3-dehydroquinate synthase [Planctomycetota bacterium]